MPYIHMNVPYLYFFLDSFLYFGFKLQVQSVTKRDNSGLFFLILILIFITLELYDITDILCAFISFTLIIIISMNIKQLRLRQVFCQVGK